MRSAVRRGISHTEIFSIAESAEPRIGPWWEAFREALAYFRQHRLWPPENHPTLGKWVARINRQFKQRNNQGPNWQGHGPNALTPDRLMALREAKYAPNAGANRTNRGGRLARIRQLIESGGTPTQDDTKFLRDNYHQGKLGKWWNKPLKNLGIE